MKRTKLILSIAVAALTLLCTSCKHSKTTVYFQNDYKYTCAAEIYEGSYETITALENAGVQPSFTFIAGAGKSVAQECKLPKTCTVVFYIGEYETEDKTLMKVQAPMVQQLGGQAVVTLSVQSSGYPGISYSNM